VPGNREVRSEGPSTWAGADNDVIIVIVKRCLPREDRVVPGSIWRGSGGDGDGEKWKEEEEGLELHCGSGSSSSSNKHQHQHQLN